VVAYQVGTYDITPFSASGGNETTTANGYTYHFYTGTSTFTVASGTRVVDVLVLAGGGGGGSYGNPGYEDGSRGGSSEFYPTPVGPGHPTGLSATGGGGGVAYNSVYNGQKDGGSGGGGAGASNAGGTAADYPAAAGYPSPVGLKQGYPGGKYATVDGAGGGGGAGAAGVKGDPGSTNMDGGIGRNIWGGDPGIPPSYGTSHPSPGRWVAGGGGGGGRYTARPGGWGGGGAGGAGGPGTPGTVNTGGGGGAGDPGSGAGHGGGGAGGMVESKYTVTSGEYTVVVGNGGASGAGGIGGAGGSGLVIIRYIT